MEKLKFEQLIDDYNGKQFDMLPKFMKRRANALKKLQLEHINIEHQYHKELQELELKYEKLYAPLYEKRYQIINGDHEPTDEECELPASVVALDYLGDEENAGEDDYAVKFSEEEEAALKSSVKGLPSFWLGCLSTTYNFNDSIEQDDRAVLKYLKDIRLSYVTENEEHKYKLEFLFDENPFFTNKVLTKTYHLRSKPEEKDPFGYNGFEVCKSEGCEINWNPGKDVTKRSVVVKQQNKSDGRTREKKKEVECDSFFYFFKPPTMPDNMMDEGIDEELAAIIAVDFELGEVIRQSVIPKAALYYVGYMDEDDDDDEDDDEDDDDDDSDDFDSDSDDSDESDDSLDKSGGKGKKFGARKSPKDKHC